MNKPKILILIDWFIPAFKAGGPIKSVTNIILSMNQEYDFFIGTSDRDLGESNSHKGVKLNSWINRGHYQIIYFSQKDRASHIKEMILARTYDIIYLNSAFSIEFTIKPLRVLNKLKLKSKIIVAPRGMFSKGGLKIKPIKKQLFIWFAKKIQLYNNVLWHATNEIEMKDIRDVFGSNTKVAIAKNISVIESKKNHIIKNKNHVNLVFFSRVSPIKNLKYILEILSKIADPNIHLDIFGPAEDKEYWNECVKIIKQNELSINYHGTLLPNEVQKTLSNFHFFILPTLNENFGHVIIEALSSGCGMLISNKTPWNNFEEKKVGWNIPLSDKSIWIEKIKYCTKMSQTEYNEFRNGAYQYALEETQTSEAVESTRQLFKF